MLERAKQSLREKDVKYIDKIRMGEHHLKRKTGGGNKSSNGKSDRKGSTVDNGSAMIRVGASGVTCNSSVGRAAGDQQEYTMSDGSGPVSDCISMLGLAGGGRAMVPARMATSWFNSIRRMHSTALHRTRCRSLAGGSHPP